MGARSSSSSKNPQLPLQQQHRTRQRSESHAAPRAEKKSRGRSAHSSAPTHNILPQHHERHVEPPGPLAQAALNPWQASSEEGRKSSDLLCSLQHILPSSPTTSFSLLWRGLSLLYETRTTPGRVLNCRAVHQGQPRTKCGLCILWSTLLSCYQLLNGIS